MNIKPLFDNVVLQTLQDNKKGQIILPVTNEKPYKAKVLAVGAGITPTGETKATPMEVKVGDTVLYNKFAGFEFNLDGEDYILIKQVDILAILYKNV